MTKEVEFFSLHDLVGSGEELSVDQLGLKGLLAQSPYAPSLKSVRIFVDEVIQLERGYPEKKSFYGLRALGEKALLGFAQFRQADEVADLDFIILDENVRGKGLAKNLLEKSLNCVRLADAKRVMLEVGETNLAAQGLYFYFGFKTISVRKKYYKGEENALVMELVL